MTHALVTQLRFTRSKWAEGFANISDAEGSQQFGQMNTLGWMMGHLANHEQSLWLKIAQGQTPYPELASFGTGQPASTPTLSEMVEKWHAITKASETFLDTVNEELLLKPMTYKGRELEVYGTVFNRIIYHYWYHLGEAQAIRQLLGHENVGNFVGHIPDAYQYGVD